MRQLFSLGIWAFKNNVNRGGMGTWIDPGVRVFAPQHLTRKGRVLGGLWYLPVSKTILIDLKLVT